MCLAVGAADATCGAGAAACPAGQTHYFVYFRPSPTAGLQYTGDICVDPARPPVSLAQVQAALAPLVSRDSLGVPEPGLVLQPSTTGVVNLPLLVHATPAGTLEKDFFDVAGFTVHVTATPTWTWTFGGEATLSTADAGRPYDVAHPAAETGPYPSGYYVSHVFGQPGSRTIGVQVTWRAAASIVGAPSPAIAPLVVDEQRVVTVREARPVLVGES